MIDTPPEPDAFEKRLRFFCGFVFGLLAGGFAVMKESIHPAALACGIVLGAALLWGYLAMSQGDRFWRGLF